jgi:hypothetical protein
MTSRRRRFKQSAAFKERLSAWAEDVRAEAEKLPPGIERDEMLKKVSRAETAAHLDDWANSPGLQPPEK